jgi:hydrogenase large subunit
VHGLASIRSVENALDYEIPKNAELIRNLMSGAQYIHDHVMHFYHLHALDWVDVVSALDADPAETSALAQSLSNYPKSSPGYFADMKKKLKDFVEAGQLGIFAKAYWGHPAYKLPPAANLMAVAHYLEALEWQRDVARLHTIFGGKNPHPNFVVGGVPCAIDLNSDSAINAKRLAQVQDIINHMKQFVDQVYVPDTLAIAGFYKDWGSRGEGLGNFLTYGDFPSNGMNDPAGYMIPPGAILGRDLGTIHEVDMNAPEEIQEFVAHSWYDYGGGKQQGLHPYDGETSLNYTGPTPPYEHLDVEQSYSWLKSPRWKGHAMEVGPLARVLMLYASGHEQTRELVGMTLRKLDIPVEALFSTLGRTAARTLETKIFADAMQGWNDDLIANIKAGDTRTFNETLWEPSSWPRRAQGVGFMEAPRGGLAHWIVIEDEKISNYQAVVPSTWNAGPRDASNQPGAYEAALQDNHTLVDPEQPVEILRTIHSFDPCIACAVHLTDPDGKELTTVKIR